MQTLATEQITPAVRALFSTGDPAALRAFAIMDGDAAGEVITDDPANPAWGIVREAGFGTLFLGGEIEAPNLHRLIADLRQRSDVLIGLWDDDPRWALMPPDPDYDGRVLEFLDRPLGSGLDEIIRRLPRGYRFRHVDKPELFAQGEEPQLMAMIYGSAEVALDKSIGFYLMRDEDILSEAFAGPFALGLAELGVATPEAHRRQGYATLVCAHVIQVCESLGYKTYWNCSKTNTASAALARRLGYQTEREYRLLAWFQLEA